MFHVAAPFGWFPAIPEVAKPTAEGDEILSLTLTSTGPVVLGLDAADDWDPDRFAFAPTGVGVDEPDRSRAMRFDHWSIELSHSDRPFERLSTLCEVDRRKRPERTG